MLFRSRQSPAAAVPDAPTPPAADWSPPGTPTDGSTSVFLSELPSVERYSRMYYDLAINMEGIDAIHHLLERMEAMRREMNSLRNQLLLYREREIEDADW